MGTNKLNIARHDQRLSSGDQQSQESSIPYSPSDDASPASSQARRPIPRRSIIRRKRIPSLIKAMSLVGLKNLFFHQTVTPIPVRSKTNYGTASNWSNGTRQPLLDQDSGLETEPLQSTLSRDSDTDVESQQDSRTEKVNRRKGFRIDARVISDATIGLSDGLTVPFALTAGLSALGNTKVVIYGGFAELIAGAISMGLGGYLGAKSEQDSYKATLHETKNQVSESSTNAAESIRDVFQPYELPQSLTDDLTFHLAKSPHVVQFLM